jgi:hypothetical protein
MHVMAYNLSEMRCITQVGGASCGVPARGPPLEGDGAGKGTGGVEGRGSGWCLMTHARTARSQNRAEVYV